MNPTDIFLGYRAAPELDVLAVSLVLIATVLGGMLFAERPKHDPAVHSPRMAWLRAGIYFCGVGLLAWLTGVWGALSAQPLVTAAQLGDPLWLGLTGLCVAMFVWGYVIWWPRGTLTHGRRLYLLPSLLFGLVWGACSAWMLLSIYAIFESFQLPAPITALGTLVVIAVYNMNYQSGWWDIHVSPPHNIRAWNTKKVLGSHNPFLLATLSFFVLYGNVGLFTVFYAAAMAASAVAMRFPPYWEADGPRVSLESAIGE